MTYIIFVSSLVHITKFGKEEEDLQTSCLGTVKFHLFGKKNEQSYGVAGELSFRERDRLQNGAKGIGNCY